MRRLLAGVLIALAVGACAPTVNVTVEGPCLTQVANATTGPNGVQYLDTHYEQIPCH